MKKIEKGEKYLPIGTVVKLVGGEKRLMIMGYASIDEEEEGEQKIWDYSGCLYPEGQLASDEVALFDHDQIDEIYYMGLAKDDEEISFIKELKEEQANV